MGGYTIKNLRAEIEDAAPQFGLSPDLEARFARDVLETEHVALSYQRLAPGFRTPFGHSHKTQEEVYVVLEGGGRVKLDDDVRDVSAWDAVRVAKDTVRCFEAGPDGLTLVAFGAPKTGPGDAELIPGWWADE